MAKFRYILFFLALLASACSNTKYLAPNQKLYTGGEIKIDDKDIKKSDAGELKEDLSSLLRPQPNSSILGLRFKLWVYNKTRTNKRTGLKHYLNTHIGEPPVLVSSVDLEKNSSILQNRLQNVSYFLAQVVGDTISKGKTAKAVYTVHAGPSYHYRSITFPKQNDDLDTAVAGTSVNSLLKVGDKYSLDVIKNERIRIDARLKEEGFFYFSPENLIMRYDSTGHNHQIDMFVKVKDATPDEARWIYKIRDIYVYPKFSLKDTSNKLDSAVKYRWYNVIDPRKTVRPFVFKNSVLLHPGDTYNRTKHNASLNRMINLGPFSYVKNRFEDVTPDSPFLDIYYQLTQYKRKALSVDLLARQTSAYYNGTQINLNFKNKNTFKGAELFLLTLFASRDLQFGGTGNGYNIYQFGIQPSISFPRFVGPLNFSTENAYIPHTILTAGYTLVNRTKLYNLNSFNASFGYTWKPDLHKEHDLNLFNFTYVDAASVSKLYTDSIHKTRNPALAHVINNQFTFGPSYSYTYNTNTDDSRTDAIYYNGKISESASLLGLLMGADTTKGKVKSLFGTPFNQYIKVENDLRYYHKFTPGLKFVTRLQVGVGYSYGNSTLMPYSQQFFIGGPNSLRGFQARSLGPGGYILPPSLNTGNNFLADESGDIKIEANAEFRPKLFSIVEGALFVDAGNIWLLRPHKFQPSAAFGSNFINQMAVDAGFGLRFNLTVLVLRTDFGFPLVKPELPASQRRIIDGIDYTDARWHGANMIFNLAIGYPF